MRGPARAGVRTDPSGRPPAHPQPRGDPALLQHPQPQPPPVGLAAKGAGPQLLIAVHDVGSTTARIVDIIARLHFWNFQRGPGPAPPTAGAP